MLDKAVNALTEKMSTLRYSKIFLVLKTEFWIYKISNELKEKGSGLENQEEEIPQREKKRAIGEKDEIGRARYNMSGEITGE